MIEINYIEVTQPIGTFYMCSIKASQLLRMVETIKRSDTENGVQRDLSPKRTKEIASFCSDPDAVFPTPIVVSVYSDKNISIDSYQKKILFPDDVIIGDVIDGQHRLWGIGQSSDADLFELPVVFMFGLNIEEKAYIFATINSNQTKVNPSLIYDLFDIATTRSPQKTAHHTARVLNSEPTSAFYNRLKMLGRKSENQTDATLSQGTFCKSLLKLISSSPDKDTLRIKNNDSLSDNNPNLPLRKFFIENSDEVIVKIIYNCFNALRDTFPQQWANPHDNILWKTTGFNGIIIALAKLIPMGLDKNDQTKEFYMGCFAKFKHYLKEKGIELTKKDFAGGGLQVQRKFANLLLSSIDDGNSKTKQIQTNIESFIKSIDDADVYDIVDIAHILKTGQTSYGIVNAIKSNGQIQIAHPMADSILSIPEKDRLTALSIIQTKFMDNLDSDSWLALQELLSKD